MRASAKILGTVLALLAMTACLVWYAAMRADHRGMLTVTLLNAGQGDAIFVETPSGRTILVDGGPDDSILRQLGEVLPFYQHSIDVVIATAQAPAKVGGLSSVLSRYSVTAVVRSAARSSAPQTQAFTAAVSHAQQNGSRLILAQRGQIVDLGSGTLLEFLFPDRDASNMSPSDGCLMFKLMFGQTSFLFACGSFAIENYLATLDGAKLRSDVLFATGNDTELFAGFVSPQFAIVPCGASTTPAVFSRLQIQTVNECNGAITLISNGQTIIRG